MGTSGTPNRLSVNGNTFDLTTPEGRFAANAYAYFLLAEDERTANEILRTLERVEGKRQ